MPDRDVRIRLFIDASNLKELATMTTLLQQAAIAEKTLMRAAINKNKAIQKQTKVIKDDGKALKSVSERLRDWTKQIAKNVGKVLEWAAATGIVFGAIRTLRTGIEDIIDVEFAMAGLTKVMQEGEGRARMLRSELLALGQQYGELGTAVIDASTEFARLQITNFEIAQSTEAALLAQAIAEMKVVEASGFLIASMQQFEQTSLSNIRTLDQWNELSNRMAVRAVDLAQATARAGSVIHNAGSEMAFLNGMTAALVQATKRSGQEIGNAIRTFGTYTFRLRSVALLEKSGIRVRNDATGQLKSFEDVISDTAIKWVLFTDVQKRAIAQAIAGTRRQNEFLTLMREFPEVLRAAGIALDSMGSAQEESAILLDTARKKAEQFRAGLQRLVAEYSNTRGLKLLLDGLNALINALIEARGLVLVLAGSLALFGIKAALATAAVAKLRVALMGLAAAHPVLLALTAAAAVGIGIYAALNREAENFLVTMIETAQASVGLAKTEEQRVKRLEDLLALYENTALALERATDPADIKKFTDDIGELAKEIESAAQAGDKAFRFDLGDNEASLNSARAILDGLRQSAEASAAAARAQIRGDIEVTRNQILGAETYGAVLAKTKDKQKAMQAAADATGLSFGEMNQLLSKTGVFIDSIFVEGKFAGGAKDAEKAIKELNAVLAELLSQSARLDLKKAFNDAVKEAIDLKALLREINSLMADNNEAARHQAALAKLGGATQMDTLRTLGSAIEKNIALVQIRRDALDAEGGKTQKLDALLLRLNKQLTNNTNKIKEANLAYKDAGLTDYIKRRTDEIKAVSGAAIQRAKDNNLLVQATELEIQALIDTKGAYQSAIRWSGLYGLSTSDLEREVRKIDNAIAMQTSRLNEFIIPAERAKDNAELLALNEKNLAREIEKGNVAIERQITVLEASGVSAVAIARIRALNAKKNLALAQGTMRSLETEEALVNALKDAYAELGIVIRSRDFEDFKLRQENIGDETQRQIELARAWGATGVQAARMRLEGLKEEGRALFASSATREEKQQEALKLAQELQNASHDLAVAEAAAAKSAADAWVKEYKRRRNAWAKLIGKGLSKKGVFDTIERIQQEMVDRWVRSAFAPIIEKLTQWEFQMLGISPEQISKQEENRIKMTQALATGGAAVQRSIITGANYHAGAIRAAMTGQPFSVPGANIGAKAAAGTTIDSAVMRELQNPVGAGGGGLNTAGQFGLAIVPTLLANIKDFATGRGGGVRAAGFGIGTGIGALLGGPGGAALGGQVGIELVRVMQDLKHAIWDDTDERKRPQAESLREQVGSAINRGTFGNAVQITYHIENNVSLGFMIPDREAGRRAITWIKQNLDEYGANVTVS